MPSTQPVFTRALAINMQSIHQLIADIAKQLEDLHKESSLRHHYAWWLLEQVTQKNKAQLMAQSTIMLTTQQEKKLVEYIHQIIREHKPINYILGSVPFLDITIDLRPPILIPRPETEEWCNLLIDKLKPYQDKPLSILDLCTGSGCIALALAHAFKKSTLYATDINAAAIELAMHNAKKNNIYNVEFLQANLYENLPQGIKFDLIVANPPYISEHEWETVELSVKDWEDRQALVAPQDGYGLIADIIKEAPKFLKQDNKLAELPAVWLEIGYRQGIGTQRLFEQHKFTGIVIEQDLNGHDRVVHGLWK
jgi:release factor glutamine methyltransferase